MRPCPTSIAGIGNIFLGDDAFGVEVARRLARRALPEGVHVVDFGIRGYRPRLRAARRARLHDPGRRRPARRRARHALRHRAGPLDARRIRGRLRARDGSTQRLPAGEGDGGAGAVSCSSAASRTTSAREEEGKMGLSAVVAARSTEAVCWRSRLCATSPCGKEIG